MSPRVKTKYPRNTAECVSLLIALGFAKKEGIGKGKHPEKYFHPTRNNTVPGDKPFIIIPHDYFDVLGMKIMKKLQNWDYTKEEIEATLRGEKYTSNDANTQVETEPEEL